MFRLHASVSSLCFSLLACMFLFTLSIYFYYHYYIYIFSSEAKRSIYVFNTAGHSILLLCKKCRCRRPKLADDELVSFSSFWPNFVKGSADIESPAQSNVRLLIISVVNQPLAHDQSDWRNKKKMKKNYFNALLFSLYVFPFFFFSVFNRIYINFTGLFEAYRIQRNQALEIFLFSCSSLVRSINKRFLYVLSSFSMRLRDASKRR